MAKVLRCRDLGMNCPKEIRAQTEEELLKLAAEHAEKDHGFPPSMIEGGIMEGGKPRSKTNSALKASKRHAG